MSDLNLNTSHVKVKLTEIRKEVLKKINLNTSHVKVKLHLKGRKTL